MSQKMVISLSHHCTGQTNQSLRRTKSSTIVQYGEPITNLDRFQVVCHIDLV
jgi:hypothetical protein